MQMAKFKCGEILSHASYMYSFEKLTYIYSYVIQTLNTDCKWLKYVYGRF